MDASQGFLAGSFLNESDVDGLGIDAISFVGQNNSNASLADASAVATYYLRCVESTSVQFSAIVRPLPSSCCRVFWSLGSIRA